MNDFPRTTPPILDLNPLGPKRLQLEKQKSRNWAPQRASEFAPMSARRPHERPMYWRAERRKPPDDDERPRHPIRPLTRLGSPTPSAWR